MNEAEALNQLLTAVGAGAGGTGLLSLGAIWLAMKNRPTGNDGSKLESKIDTLVNEQHHTNDLLSEIKGFLRARE